MWLTQRFLAAVGAVSVSADFPSGLQLTIPSLLSTSSQEHEEDQNVLKLQKQDPNKPELLSVTKLLTPAVFHLYETLRWRLIKWFVDYYPVLGRNTLFGAVLR